MAQTQTKLLHVLQFHLFPPTCAQVISSVMDIVEWFIQVRIVTPLVTSLDPLERSTTHQDLFQKFSKLMDQIKNCALNQIELRLFYQDLAWSKPSILAMDAVENAFHQVLIGSAVIFLRDLDSRVRTTHGRNHSCSGYGECNNK